VLAAIGDLDRVTITSVAVSIVLSVLVAVALGVSLVAALVLIGLVLTCALVVRLGLLGIGLALTGALPWLVVLSGALPRLVETFTAGATVAVLLALAAPRHDGSKRAFRLRVGIALFFVPTIIALARDPGGEQFIQAAKYVMFPLAVLAVTDATNRPALARLRGVALVSGVAAITVNLGLGATGVANGTYYRTGEVLGLGGEHDVALLAGCVTAACLGMAAMAKWAPAAIVGTIATIATGVRATLPGLLLIVLARLSNSGARARTLAVVTLAVVAVFVSGAANVVGERFTHGQQGGEFQSLANVGSGRGAIYATAVKGWWASSPVDWALGTGLRTIPALEQQTLGQAFVGHSDVVEVGVQIGLVGLVGLLLIWWSFIAGASSKLPLLVLAPFALFNGALEYVAPMVVAVLLTASPTVARDGTTEADESPRPSSDLRATANAVD
jgi:hypothetical protein